MALVVAVVASSLLSAEDAGLWSPVGWRRKRISSTALG